MRQAPDPRRWRSGAGHRRHAPSRARLPPGTRGSGRPRRPRLRSRTRQAGRQPKPVRGRSLMQDRIAFRGGGTTATASGPAWPVRAGGWWVRAISTRQPAWRFRLFSLFRPLVAFVRAIQPVVSLVEAESHACGGCRGRADTGECCNGSARNTPFGRRRFGVRHEDGSLLELPLSPTSRCPIYKTAYHSASGNTARGGNRLVREFRSRPQIGKPACDGSSGRLVHGKGASWPSCVTAAAPRSAGRWLRHPATLFLTHPACSGACQGSS